MLCMGGDVMNKGFHWEVHSIDELVPYYVFTKSDSLTEVERQLKKNWRMSSVRSIRKIAEFDGQLKSS